MKEIRRNRDTTKAGKKLTRNEEGNQMASIQWKYVDQAFTSKNCQCIQWAQSRYFLTVWTLILDAGASVEKNVISSIPRESKRRRDDNGCLRSAVFWL
jgi:hypothetical protein